MIYIKKIVQIELFKTLYINKFTYNCIQRLIKLNSRVIVDYSFHKKDIVENELVIQKFG